MKKRILLLYATYGSGHKAIANYIESYFNQKSDYEILKIDVLDYALPFLGKLSKKMNEFLMLRMPYIWSIVYNSTGFGIGKDLGMKLSMTLFKNKILTETIKNFNPDLAICTHFFGPELIKKYNDKKITNSRIITIITDYETHGYWIVNRREEDYYIVGSNSEANYMVKKGFNRKHIKVYGIPINPIINDDFDIEKYKKRFHFYNYNLTCLFFGGGGNGSLSSISYLKKLISRHLDLNIIFIAGKNDACKKKAERLIKSYKAKNIKVLGYVTNVPELLQLADFVITKPGGVQTTECIYYKKPMILINSSGGQENANYHFIEDMGYGKMFKTNLFFGSYIRKIIAEPHLILDKKKNFNTANADKSMASLFKLATDILNDNK